ncbi:MAG: hypothetical protein ACTMIK_13265 [Galactobacter sp.]
MNRANLWLALGTLCIGAGVALARHQMLLGLIALAAGVGFLLLTRRERARMESIQAQRSELDPD